MSSNWTNGDIENLTLAYNQDMPVDEIALRLKRSERAVRVKLARLNLKRGKHVWTRDGLRRRKQATSQFWSGRLGRIPWNKGKKTGPNPRISMAKLSNTEAMKSRGQWMRQYNLTRKDYSQPWNRGMHPWEWMGISQEEYLIMMAKAQARKPTQLELRVMTVIEKYNLPFRYVGDGQVWIAGKCPDFINTNNEKQLIEVLGDYWHTDEEAAERVEHYARFGFETILIWEHEIKDKPDQVILEKLEYNPEVQNAIQCDVQSHPTNR